MKELEDALKLKEKELEKYHLEKEEERLRRIKEEYTKQKEETMATLQVLIKKNPNEECLNVSYKI